MKTIIAIVTSAHTTAVIQKIKVKRKSMRGEYVEIPSGNQKCSNIQRPSDLPRFFAHPQKPADRGIQPARYYAAADWFSEMKNTGYCSDPGLMPAAPASRASGNHRHTKPRQGIIQAHLPAAARAGRRRQGGTTRPLV